MRVDHTIEREVTALFRRILRTHHRLDVVVDSVAGEEADDARGAGQGKGPVLTRP